MFNKFHLILITSLALVTSSFSMFAAEQKVLYRGNGAEPVSIDPHFVTGLWENNIVGDLFMGLTTEAADGKVIPGLAESWEISEDGKIYTFKIRKANWSDGKPITANDFVFSLRRILDPLVAAKYAFILYPIKNAEKVNKGELPVNELGVKATSNSELVIELENVTPFFLEQLTHYTAFAVPEHIVKKYGKNWTKKNNIVVSGAFDLDSWEPQTKIKVVKNDKFWDAKNVKLDAVIFYPIEDANSELKRYRAGELDIVYVIPSGQFESLKKKFGKELRVVPLLGIYYYPVNTTKITDVKVRRALSLAINRSFITDKILGEGQIPAYSFVVNGVNNYETDRPYLDFANNSYKENLAEAKKIMQEAGYTKKKPLKLELKYNTNEAHKKVAIAISGMWKEIGVETSLFNQETKVHYANLKNADFEVGRAGWIGDYNDPTTFTDLFLDNSYNYGRYFNKELIKKAKEAAKVVDLKKRADILAEVEKLALEGNSNIPIYYYVSKHLVSNKVTGWEDNIKDIHRSRWMDLK